MAKYVVKFPDKIEANTIQEIMDATGWSRGTVYRILDGESRFPATIEVNGRSKKKSKIQAQAKPQELVELPAGAAQTRSQYLVRS